MNVDQLEGEDLIDFLESKLEDIEKKLARSQNDYEELQNDCLEIQDKLSFQKEKYKRAALMLTEFLEDLLSQKPNILRDQMASISTQEQKEQDTLDLEKIQNTPIEDLDREDKVRVMFMLLKQLQPFLSANNLTVVAPPRGVHVNSNLISSLEQMNLGKAGYSPNRSKQTKPLIQNNFLSNSQVVKEDERKKQTSTVEAQQ